MKMLWGHILRTWRNAPRQPLLILLTVALAVAVGVTSWSIGDIFLERSESLRERRTALGQMVITMNADRDVRMLFSDDAERLVGEDGVVLGEYALTAFLPTEGGQGRRVASLAATDLLAADQYFSFTLVDSLPIPENRLRDAAVVSESFAVREGLLVGDQLDMELLGERVAFTVYAIACDEGLLAERQVLVNHERIVGLLALHSPAIAALGDSFAPCTRLMIQCDEAQAETLFARVEESVAFADCHVELCTDGGAVNVPLLIQTGSVSLLAFLLLILSSLLILSAHGILLRQRRREHALLCVAGASPAHLLGSALAESALLSVVGGVIGVLLSTRLTPWIGSFFAWRTSPVLVGASGWIVGLLLALLLGCGCTWISLGGQGRFPLAERLSDARYPMPFHPQTRRAVASLVVACASVLLMAAAPVEYVYIAAILALVTGVLAVYMSFPLLLRGVFNLSERWVSVLKRWPCVWTLAIKNLKNHGSLGHVARLWAVLVAMTVTVSMCGRVLSDQEQLFKTAVLSELIAVGVPSATLPELESSPVVKGVATLWVDEDAGVNDRYTAMVVAASGDVTSCVSEDFLPERLPSEGETVVSKGMAALLGVGIGDPITVSVQGHVCTATVSFIQNTNSNIVFLPPDTATMSDPVTCIRLSEHPSAHSWVVTTLESAGAYLVDRQELDGGITDTLSGFISLSRAALVAALTLSLVGCVNAYTAHYRVRRQERLVLLQSGMSRSALRRTYLAELVLVFSLATAVGALVSGGFLWILHIGMRSFGCSLF